MSRLILGNIFAANGSVNFYMFHGGTNFGFMNGANILGYNGIINYINIKYIFYHRSHCKNCLSGQEYILELLMIVSCPVTISVL